MELSCNSGPHIRVAIFRGRTEFFYIISRTFEKKKKLAIIERNIILYFYVSLIRQQSDARNGPVEQEKLHFLDGTDKRKQRADDICLYKTHL